jgi:hypothetical protein
VRSGPGAVAGDGARRSDGCDCDASKCTGDANRDSGVDVEMAGCQRLKRGTRGVAEEVLSSEMEMARGIPAQLWVAGLDRTLCPALVPQTTPSLSALAKISDCLFGARTGPERAPIGPIEHANAEQARAASPLLGCPERDSVRRERYTLSPSTARPFGTTRYPVQREGPLQTFAV